MCGSGAPHYGWCAGGRGGTQRCRRGEGGGGGDTPCVRAADGAQCVLFIY